MMPIHDFAGASGDADGADPSFMQLINKEIVDVERDSLP